MSLDAIFAHHGRVEIAATPEGHDAFVLGGLAARGAVKTLLYICRDDGRMARTLQAQGIWFQLLAIAEQNRDMRSRAKSIKP